MFPAHRCSANLIKSLFSACQAEPEKERERVCAREEAFLEKSGCICWEITLASVYRKGCAVCQGWSGEFTLRF